MGNLILALVSIIVLLIMKFESSVTNKEVLQKMENLHLKVRDQMLIIVNNPYSVNKKVIQNWILALFVGLAIVNYFSMLIFGADSPKNPLKNEIIFSYSIVGIFIVVASLNRRDLVKMLPLLVISVGIGIYFMHTGMALYGIANPFKNDFHYSPYFADAIIIFAGIMLIMITILLVYSARLFCNLLYFVLQKILKLSLHYSPEKPIRILMLFLSILTILIGALIPLFL